MASSKPLISVIIPAYNAERFMVSTLESVLSQTYAPIEVLVIDDGSTDATAALVDRYRAKDPRIRLFSQPNAGVAAARNHGIAAARGEFIAPIDADDIWFPEFLEQVLEPMADPAVGLVYAWSVFIDEQSQLMKTCQCGQWEGRDWIPLVYRNLPGNASCVLLRRDAVLRVGGYDPSHRDRRAQGCEDWDLYLRLAERYMVRVIPRLLVGYRQVTGSMSANPVPMQRGVNLVLAGVVARHPELDPAICAWNRSIFAWYLAQKCGQAGNHWGALTYLGQALALDYFPLLRVGFYRLGLAAALKGISQPLTGRIWPDHRAWLTFKSRLKTTIQALDPWHRPLSLEQLQRRQVRAKGRFPRWYYEALVAWRCDRIRRHAQRSTLEQQAGVPVHPAGDRPHLRP
jgi:glycosyltransferase involved in cell wall biosynthesis